MKRTLRLIVGILAIIALTASGFQGFQKYQFKSELRKRRPPNTIHYEKPMVVMVPSYNNSQYCIRNLRSIFDQKYKNFRVIYIEDCSKDDTYEQVKSYLRTARADIPVTLIHNKTNRGALANLYNAIHSCSCPSKSRITISIIMLSNWSSKMSSTILFFIRGMLRTMSNLLKHLIRPG